MCEDGHYVRSLAEMTIDNWLYKHGFIHSYEKKCFFQNTESITVICDFYIPDFNVYIEYWGKYDKEYIARKKAKQKIYNENNIKLINVDFENMKNLNDYLKKSLNKYK